MDHSRRLASIHLHHSPQAPLNGLHHSIQPSNQHQNLNMNLSHLQQSSHSHHIMQQQQQSQQQQQLSSLQELINRHQQQQQHQLQQQQNVADQLMDDEMIGDNHGTNRRLVGQQQQQRPAHHHQIINLDAAAAALALQKRGLHPGQLVDNPAALLSSALGPHINLIGHHPNPHLSHLNLNQQQQLQQLHHAQQQHQLQQQLKQQQQLASNNVFMHHHHSASGQRQEAATSLPLNMQMQMHSLQNNVHVPAKPNAQSPNSTGCISDSCSRSSSSGTSSVSPQPPSNHHQSANNNNSSSNSSQRDQSSTTTTAAAKKSSQVGQQSATGSLASNRKLSTSSTASSNASMASAASAAAAAASHCSIFELIPELLQDGLNLEWHHETNTRARLYESINELPNDPRRVIAGDVSLAEMSRYPLPIMARAPIGVSDVTLENWFSELVQSNPHRAIKLTFSTTRAVEPAFRVLARHADSFKGALILNANILALPSNSISPTGNNPNSNSNAANGKSTTSGAGKQSKAQQQQNSQQQQQNSNNQNQNQPEGPNQPVDAWTFLMLCRTRFPRSTISIGWCQPEESVQRSQSVASSTTIFDMETSDNSGNQQLQQQQPILSQLQHHLTTPSLRQASASSGAHRLHPYQFAGSPAHLAHQRLINSENQLLNSGTTTNVKNNHHHHHHHHQRLLSSSASLNSSSSGHSSGSSSPTSPIGSQSANVCSSLSPALKIFRPHHDASLLPASCSPPPPPASSNQQAVAQLFFDHHNHRSISGGDKAAVAAATAAAAALAAAVAAAASASNAAAGGPETASSSSLSPTSSSPSPANSQSDGYQQMPLNLNINEADSSITSSQHQQNQANSLSELAQRIQSYNQRLALRNSQDHQQQHSQSSQSTHQTSVIVKNLTNSKLQQTDLLLKTTLQQQQHQITGADNKTIVSGGATINSSSSSSGNAMQCYTREMIDKMAAIVKEYSLTQPITFPIEARLARNSLVELQRLLYQVGANSSLTIVAQQDDLNSVSVDDLIFIRESFAPNQVLYDLPEQLASSFRQELAGCL